MNEKVITFEVPEELPICGRIKFVSQNLQRELQMLPTCTMYNSYQEVIFKEMTPTHISYIIRYGQVRELADKAGNPRYSAPALRKGHLHTEDEKKKITEGMTKKREKYT